MGNSAKSDSNSGTQNTSTTTTTTNTDNSTKAGGNIEIGLTGRNAVSLAQALQGGATQLEQMVTNIEKSATNANTVNLQRVLNSVDNMTNTLAANSQQAFAASLASMGKDPNAVSGMSLAGFDTKTILAIAVLGTLILVTRK